VILDTNALSAFADGIPQIGVVLGHASEMAVPAIVLGEYRYGLAHSTRRHYYETWLDGYLHLMRVLPVTDSTAIKYAAIRSELRKSGKPIPANDAWIAALAREHNLPVLSRDNHIDRVAGLRRLKW
jgi:tRNA(fMet)-specific endonuclease VapC